MLQTLVGVIVGGTLSILSQLMADVLRVRGQRRQERGAAVAVLRVQQLHFYSGELLIKQALETGRWWPQELVSFTLPTDQELAALAMLLPIEAWRGYTAAVRRFAACTHLRGTAGATVETIDGSTLQRLLGTFVTLAHARHVISPLSGIDPSDVELGTIQLSTGQIDEALHLHASRQVRLETWIGKIAGLKDL